MPTVTRVHLTRREALALTVLAALTAALAGAGRQVLPAGLAQPITIPGTDDHVNRQVSGFIDVPSDGRYRLMVTSTSGAHLAVDGRVVAATRAEGGASDLTGVLLHGAHRIVIQYDGNDADAAPSLKWSRSNAAPQPVPRASLSPNRLTQDAWRFRRVLQPLSLALSLLWVGAFAWLIVTRAIAWLKPRVPDAPRQQRAVWAVLGLSLVLTSWAVWWGLPMNWAQDEIWPDTVLEALGRRFSGGWHFKYPPLHLYVLALVYAPVLVAGRLGLVDVESPAVFVTLALVGRLVSVTMHVATTAFMYLCARSVVPHRAAVGAALMWVLVLPAIYYGKLANLDIPYTFWFAASLLAYLRALRLGRTQDYVSFAVLAVLAVCTKDQAYALYVLPALHLAAVRARHHGGVIAGLPRLVKDGPLVVSFLTAGLLFALIQNLAFNWSGFIGHVGLITGGGSRSFRMVDSASVSGQAWLLGRAIRQIVWSMSLPGALLAAIGIVLAIRDVPRSRLWPLFLPVASYYLTLIAIIGFHYDRFWIPVCLVLSIFAGLALDRACPPGASRWRAAGAIALIAYMALRTSSIDMLMAADSRYATQRWMREHLRPGDRVVRFETWEMAPWMPGFAVSPVAVPAWDLPDIRPDAVVGSDDFPRRWRPGTPEAAWFETLVSGRLGYRVAFRHRSRVRLAILAFEPQFASRDGSFTILHKTNLEMFVLVPDGRLPGSGP